MEFFGSRLFMMILPALIKTVSPVLIAQLQPLLDQLRETARSTQNPWDDILVQFLEELLKELTLEYRENRKP